MKLKRSKHSRKVLGFYRTNFGYLAPYKVLVDGTFCKAALTFQLNIQDQLRNYLESDIQLCTTACVTGECQALGSKLFGPLKVLQQYAVEPCGHDPHQSAANCMFRLARSRKYLIGTQDPELSDKLRKRGGIPLLYIAHKTVTLEAPSEKSHAKALEKTKSKMTDTGQHDMVSKLKKEIFGDEEEEKPKKKRKGPKGANPLSCQKSKKKKLDTQDKEGTIEKPKRKRTRHKRLHKPTVVQLIDDMMSHTKS